MKQIVEVSLNLEENINSQKPENNEKRGLKKKRNKVLLILSAISIFLVTLIGIVLSFNFYYGQNGQKNNYTMEFRSDNPRGFWELEGCIGIIRFQPGFWQGTIFE